MRIVVMGGTGLIGQKLIRNLRELGHDAVSASPRSGVNAVTGEGLTEALAGADVVVDVTNSPSFEDQAVLQFFEASSRNLLTAEATAGVGHHLALSVVGADRIPDSGYMRAKVAQERLIKSSPVPYTILRATQFFEFLDTIASANVVGREIRLPAALMQPVAADDVAAALTEIAIRPALYGTLEVAGPETIPMDELIRRFLKARQDSRTVTTDHLATYFGAKVDSSSLIPDGKHPRLGKITLLDWVGQPV